MPILPFIDSEANDWAIVKLNENRKKFVNEITRETVQKILSLFANNDALYDELSSALYQEKIRITEKKWKVDPADESEFWGNIRKQLLINPVENNPSELRKHLEQLLKNIVSRYANEIVGKFEINTFKFARNAVEKWFNYMLTTATDRSIKRLKGEKPTLKDRIHFLGDTKKIKRLSELGTVIILPTHFSNLDSILVGWSIEKLGMPPFSYGAGINLYNNPIMGYFMNRLGAYKVDRRKKNMIYLETLKTNTQLSLQKSCHNLFFPGGTRSRAGKIEDHLKMGLLGTAIEAQEYNLFDKEGNGKKLFIVPLVINYHLVLEANGLINDYLAHAGQEKYLSKDQFSNPFLILKFLWKLFGLGSEIYLSYGEPMDLFGNAIDDDGNSIDKYGRKVDIKQYFYLNGIHKHDHQRNSEYTRHLANEVVMAFHKYNVVLSSHLVAYTAFEILLNQYKKLDLYEIIRLPKEYRIIPRNKMETAVEKILAKLNILAAKRQVILAPHLSKDTSMLIEHGIRQMGVYHTTLPLRTDEDGNITSDNLKLLYYYHNRLEGYGLRSVLRNKILSQEYA
jgi:glycerol-3-phosphate O-acyltransferase